MATLEEVLVADLNEMGAEELRSRGMIKVKDLENLTERHIEKLRLLVNGLDKSRGLDLEAVNEKLCNLTEAASTISRSRSSRGPTPDANDPVNAEKIRQNCLRRENEAYRDLIEDGWPPSHRPSESNFDFLYDPENHTDIIWYWIVNSPTKECILQTQRTHWKDFRVHQDWRRERYWKPEWFEQFIQEVNEYRLKKGIEGDICLLRDRKKQTRLDDWKEFQYWELRKADQLVKEMDRYTEAVKGQEERLQAAIDAGHPANKIEMIRDHSLALMKGGRGTVEIDLRGQNVLLKWIDEQLPIIASESRQSATSAQVPDDCPSTSISTNLGKRKKSADQTNHVKQSRRRVEFAEPFDRKLSPVENADVRGSKLVDLPKLEAPNTRSTKYQSHRSTHMETSAAGAVVHVSDISKPVQRKSSRQRTNSKSDRTSVNPVQTQSKRGSVRAGSNTSGLRQKPATTSVKEKVHFQKSTARLATSATSSQSRTSTASASQSALLGRVHLSRVSKARRQAQTQVLPEVAFRKSRQKDTPATVQAGKDSVKNARKKQHLAEAPVRRSARLLGKPTVC